MSRDITPEEYARIAFDAFDHAVRVTDPGTGEVLFANRAAREMLADKAWGECFGRPPEDACRSSSCVFYNERARRWFRCAASEVECPGGGVVRCEEAFDITDLKAAEEAHREQTRAQSVLHSISTRLLQATRAGLEDAIQACLAEVGEAAGVDRVCLFELARDGNSVSLSHEWCPATVEPLRFQLQELGVADAPWCMGEMRAGRHICLQSPADVPEEGALERAIMERMGIRSIVSMPMRSNERLVGFIGFHASDQEREWRPAMVESFRTVAAIFTGAIERRRHADSLQEVLEGLRRGEERYRTLFEHSPVALWDIDLSPVRDWVQEMGGPGGMITADYLKSPSADVRALLSRVRVMRVNRAALQLHGADDWSQLTNLGALVPDGSLEAVAEMARELSQGHRVLEMTGHALTLQGGLLSVVMHLAVAPGHEGDLSRVFASEMDVTELRQAQQRARDSRAQLRALAARVDAVREEERARLARRIHDDIGHTMTALKIDLAWLVRRLGTLIADDEAPHVRERLESMGSLLSDTIRAAQETATELRPGALDDLGLPAALEWEAETFRNRTGMRCEFVCNCPGLSLKRFAATAIYRICQELLTNVVRHAEATHVRIRLSEVGDEIVLEVKDNGVGITPEEVDRPRSLGLLGIRERVIMLGGEFEIEGVQGEGTRAMVRMPAHRTEYSVLE